jgi:DNA-binding CsgD family transcriptional regulator
MAEQTVKNHLTRVYDKVGVFRRTELMRAFRDFDAEDFQPHDPTTDK